VRREWSLLEKQEMGMFKSSETLTDAELNEISGGELVGPGIWHSNVGGFSFEYNANTGATYIGAGRIILQCYTGSGGGCRP
jgi:bacteriocin-like protein